MASLSQEQRNNSFSEVPYGNVQTAKTECDDAPIFRDLDKSPLGAVNPHRLPWHHDAPVPVRIPNPLAAHGKYAQLERLFSRYKCFVCGKYMWCQHRDLPAWEAELECEERKVANGK